jgi:hypothetical protein
MTIFDVLLAALAGWPELARLQPQANFRLQLLYTALKSETARTGH